MVRRFPALLLCVVFAGCARGGGADAGTPPIDSGPRDSGLMDSGMTMTDSGMTDSGTTDSGMTDSGMTDSGMMGMDARVDSGFDAGVDSGPPPACMVAADCSDGLVCNGVERCEFGRCGSGTAPTCDDGIACTRDACVEGAMASCRYTPDNSLCPGGGICGAAGCVAACSESPCRLVAPQCGCPSGQGCYISGGARLCTSAGGLPPGAICTGLASCVPGSICIDVSRSGPAVNMCNRFCNLDSECAGGICFYTLNDGMGGSIPGVTICTTACDPIRLTGCPAGSACTIFQESMGAMRYFTDCTAPFGAGGQGAPCTDQANCRGGTSCFGMPGTCLTWCDRPGTIGAAGGCRLGEACYGFMTPIRVGATTYGVCDTFP